MAQTIHLQRRLTNVYGDGWSDLDDWRDAGSAKLLPMRKVRDGNGHDDLGAFIVHAVVKATPGTSLHQARVALADQLSQSSCRHEHDCCGCQFRSAHVIHAHKRKVVLRMSVGRNY